MIKLEDGELKDIMPIEFTRQPQVIAISYALKQAYNDLFACQKSIYVYAFIDGAPEYVLDLLAVELNVRYYRQDYALDVKRQLVKEALITDAKDGTRYAVEKAIQTIFRIGHIEEWYEYSGTPNHFRIEVEPEDNYDLSDLFDVIESVKRKTARLDQVNMTTNVSESVYFGHITVEGCAEAVGCETPEIPPASFAWLGDENGDILSDENSALLFEM